VIESLKSKIEELEDLKDRLEMTVRLKEGKV